VATGPKTIDNDNTNGVENNGHVTSGSNTKEGEESSFDEWEGGKDNKSNCQEEEGKKPPAVCIKLEGETKNRTVWERRHAAKEWGEAPKWYVLDEKGYI
jgi:hypothetical protein